MLGSLVSMFGELLRCQVFSFELTATVALVSSVIDLITYCFLHVYSAHSVTSCNIIGRIVYSRSKETKQSAREQLDC